MSIPTNSGQGGGGHLRPEGYRNYPSRNRSTPSGQTWIGGQTRLGGEVFTGGIAELTGHFYDCATIKQAYYFVSTTKDILKHVGRTYLYGGDI